MNEAQNWNGARPMASPAAPPRVIVVGAGFGGLSAVKGLRGRPVQVVLVDQHNYHLFTPLLYQVASSLLDPSEIAHPVRAMLRGAPNVRVQLGEVRSIDPAARQVELDDACIGYDYLVLAAGSVNDYFGHDELGTRTYGLKDLDQALGSDIGCSSSSSVRPPRLTATFAVAS